MCISLVLDEAFHTKYQPHYRPTNDSCGLAAMNRFRTRKLGHIYIVGREQRIAHPSLGALKAAERQECALGAADQRCSLHKFFCHER